MDIFILDSSRKVVNTIYIGDGSSPISSDKYVRYLKTGAETIELTVTLDDMRAETCIEGNYILFFYNGRLKMMQIKTANDVETPGSIQRELYAEFVGLELANDIVRPTRIEGNPRKFLQVVLQDTNYQVGGVSPLTDQDIQTITIDKPTPVYTVLQNAVSQFNNIEYEFTVDCKDSITGQYEFKINIYADGERGRRTFKRFEYDYNTYGTSRKGDITEFCAGLIPTGANGLTIKDVEWLVADGDPLDKPLGQDFLLDPEAHSKFSNGTDNPILGVHESKATSSADLLWETYYKLQEIKHTKFSYQIPIMQSGADYLDLEIGDTVAVVNPKFTPPIQLHGRLDTITISFTDPDQSDVEIANFKEVQSKIRNLTPNDILTNTINAIVGLGVGKLGENDITVLRNLLSQLDLEKTEIDKILTQLINALKPPIPQLPSTVPEDSEDYSKITVSKIDGGLWIGDEKIYDILKNEVATVIVKEEVTIERPVPSEGDSQQYKEAVKYYEQFWLGTKQNTTTLMNVIKGTDSYKIGVMVRYWCGRYGLDERLVYAMMMAESSMNPNAATSTSVGGYGLMQCERGVYFNKKQTLRFLDGSTSSFTPSYNTMKPGRGGKTTVNGVSVDRNINNQIMFGCNELRMNLERWRYNIFATLIGYNMGIGAMGWILNKYVCDTYGYKFNGSRNISNCSAEVKSKAYEVLDTFKGPFAPWRKQWQAQGGGGTLQNIEYYLRYYAPKDNQLPYCLNSSGKKVGYGVNTPSVTEPTKPTGNKTRQVIVDLAKSIVDDHNASRATYDQSYRTIDYDSPRRHPGTFYGMRNPVCYDCSSFVGCCYDKAGMPQLKGLSCSAGTLVRKAISVPGWKSWKVTSSSIAQAIPGDIVMDANSAINADKIQSNPAYCSTHHTMIYIGDGKVAHASKWAYKPDAIKISTLTYYINKGSAFFLRPGHIKQFDDVQSEADKPVNPEPGTDWVTDTIIQEKKIVEQTLKGVPHAIPSDYVLDDYLVQTVTREGVTDNLSYPNDVPYVFVHFGDWDLTNESIYNAQNLLLALKHKYKNTPIFIGKLWKATPAYANYQDHNTRIQNFNDAMVAFSNENSYIIQLDYAGLTDGNGVILDSLTTNGWRLKDTASITKYYNNIKDAVKNKRIGGISKTATANQLTKNVIDIIANANNIYNAGICKSFKFNLPTYTTIDYWSKFTFSTATSGEPTKFYQPDNVWLEGNDCIEGALIPKAATTYNVVLYASAVKDDFYGVPYFGTVNSITNDGSYDAFEKFVGGEELATLAESYYTNRGNLTFLGVDKTPADYPNPAASIGNWKSGSSMGVTSRAITKFCSMGVGYDDSPYKKNDMTKVNRNTLRPWSWDADTGESNQGKYMVEQGWSLSDVDLTNFTNLHRGDFIYYCSGSNTNYLSITQVAIYVGDKQAISVDNKTGGTVVKYTLDASNVIGTPAQIVMVARPRKE